MPEANATKLNDYKVGNMVFYAKSTSSVISEQNDYSYKRSLNNNQIIRDHRQGILCYLLSYFL